MLYNCKPNIHLNPVPSEYDRAAESAGPSEGKGGNQGGPMLHKYQLKKGTEANLPPERCEGARGTTGVGKGRERGRRGEGRREDEGRRRRVI